MDTKRFIVVMSCLTVLFCILTIFYNFYTMPPFGAAAVVSVSEVSHTSEKSASSPGVSPPQTSASVAASSKADTGTVSRQGASVTSRSSSASSKQTPETPVFPIKINSASKAELMELPGIGETLADRIIAYRTANGAFKTLEELDNVKGIGSATLKKIQDKISLS